MYPLQNQRASKLATHGFASKSDTRHTKKPNARALGFFERCVPLTRNVMCPLGVMLTSSVMCASRMRRAERHHITLRQGCNTSLCVSTTSLRRSRNFTFFDSEVFRNFVDAFRAFRVCRQIRTATQFAVSFKKPTSSKFIYKAIDAKAFWTDLNLRKT